MKKPRLIWAVTLMLLPTLAFANGLQTILQDKHTVFFIAVNCFLTYYFGFKRFDRFAVAYGPEILTTSGIFGCFLGIALALLDFDATQVSASVPHLLEGVKTAFWASVSGVAGALVIKARHRLQKTPIQQTEGAPKGATIDDLVAATQALQKSLSGGDEGSLLGQIKLMRQDQKDELQALRTSFDTFAKKMAEDGSKALIDALREVISDFNNKISEQFGENFKLLNAAVEKLVLWQQQYKDEMDRLQISQHQSSMDLNAAANGMSLMVERAAGFRDVASDLDALLKGLAQQQAMIETSQKSLAAVLMEMRDVAPQFAKKFEDLMDAMTRGVSKLQSDVADVVKNLGNQVQASNSEMKSLLTDTLKKSQTEVNEQLTKSLESVRQGVITLDKGLQEELSKSLETLGRQLASLSEKFVADYGPLTDRLREIIRLSEGRLK
jgi:DNA anti-recombination protein RmuC